MKKKKKNFPVTYLISQSWQQKSCHSGNIYEYATCTLDTFPDKIACSLRKRGWRYKVAMRIPAYIFSPIAYIRDMLSQKYKKRLHGDCIWFM